MCYDRSCIYIGMYLSEISENIKYYEYEKSIYINQTNFFLFPTYIYIYNIAQLPTQSRNTSSKTIPSFNYNFYISLRDYNKY